MPPAAPPKLRLLVRHSAAEKDVAMAEKLLASLSPLERFAGVDVLAGGWKLRALDAADNKRLVTNAPDWLVEASPA